MLNIGQNVTHEMIQNTGDAAECFDTIETAIYVHNQLEETYRVHAVPAEAQGDDGRKTQFSRIIVRLDAFRERCIILDTSICAIGAPGHSRRAPSARRRRSSWVPLRLDEPRGAGDSWLWRPRCRRRLRATPS